MLGFGLYRYFLAFFGPIVPFQLWIFGSCFVLPSPYFCSVIEKKDAAPLPPATPGSKGDHEAQKPHHKIHIPKLKNMKGNCKQYCGVILYVLLGVLTILASVAVIVVTSIASVATKIYDAEQSSRLVAMVVLAVTAAVTLSMVIYAVIGVFRKQVKSVHATGIVLIILAIIQALIIGLAIKITAKDELNIGKSLSESFRLAKEDSPRHVKVWTNTQSDISGQDQVNINQQISGLTWPPKKSRRSVKGGDNIQNDFQCCGVYGPEDYRDPAMPYYFPPNIPISCCASFDDNKPSYSQERQREKCKVSGTYYEKGCKGLIITVFKETSVAVIGIIVVLIVCEVLLTILGAYLNKKHKADPHHDNEPEKPTKN